MLDHERGEIVSNACRRYGNDRRRMLDILLDVQDRLRCIEPAAMETIARLTGVTRVAVEGVASFYSFFSAKPKGRIAVRICDDIVDRFQGLEEVVQVFEKELDVKIGQTSPDGAYSLDYTPCIGMCDQAPAAMVNDLVFTSLTAEKAKAVAVSIRDGGQTAKALGADVDALSAYQKITTMVANNVVRRGDVLLGEVPKERGLRRAMRLRPQRIIGEVIASGLRGCGGAGFGTGLKWKLAAEAPGTRRFIICNADEGEPGTFKDRVLLTERPHLLFEGMTVAARAVGAKEGILYLRGEYLYLRAFLDEVLAHRRTQGLLGRNIGGAAGFDFDIRIQLGAGAYICGEEGALISSCEGLPGEPKTRPPFPVTRGYLGCPTVVNNVESFCHAARILDRGGAWFKRIGTEKSPGTKLFSVSGDCERPGVYELPYGPTVRELLDLAGATAAAAVQVGGPSGTMIGRDGFGRRLCFEDLPTGGAVVVFSGERDILEVVEYYMDFFVEESCGYCTPCRVGNVFLKMAIEKLRAGHSDHTDLEDMKSLCRTVAETSRCGLGQTSPNPILSTMDNFPLVYSASCKKHEKGINATFDIQKALTGSRHLAKRRSYLFDPDFSQ